MGAKKRSKKRRDKRFYSKTFKAEVVARILRGRARRSETQRAISDELGISETLLSSWVRQAPKTSAARAAPPSAAALEASTPTIELKGLRSWVQHAVRVEVERILKEKGLE